MNKFLRMLGSNALLLVCFSLYADIRDSQPLTVMTYPDGYREIDGTAYLFKKNLSVLEFYLYTKDKAIEMEKTDLEICLPKGLEVSSYGTCVREKGKRIWTKKYDMIKEEKKDAVVWKIPCSSGLVNTKVSVPKGLLEIHHSSYHIFLFLRPAANFDLENVLLDWSLQKEGVILATGKIKTEFLSEAQTCNVTKKIVVSALFPIYFPCMDKKDICDLLESYKACGINNIITTTRGSNLFHDWDYIYDMLVKSSFSMTDDKTLRNLFIYGWETLPKFADEKYYPVGLSGKRQKSFEDCPEAYHSHPWCPTVFASADSDIFKMQADRLKNAYSKGIRYFFSDTEPALYSECFCTLCRKAFAGYANLDEKEILTLPPLDLIYKYPLEWYRFKSWQTGNLFLSLKRKLSSECPDIQLSMDSNLNTPWTYMDGLGYGAKIFAEDARLTDFGVDYHHIDSIAGGYTDVELVECFFRNKEISKPKIARAGFLMGYNWSYSCIAGKREAAKNEGCELGLGKRGELLKLSIANMTALGVEGVELDVFGWDADLMNNIAMATNFASEFEDFFRNGTRKELKTVQVYDLTEQVSPYHKIAKKFYGTAKNYIYGPVSSIGFISYTVHENDNAYLISLFNWDHYQDKNILMKIPAMQTDKCYVYMFDNGNKYLLTADKKEFWNYDDVAKGIFFKIPKSGIVSITVSKEAMKKHSDDLKRETSPVPSIILAANLYDKYWKKKYESKKEKNLKMFYMNIYNPALTRINRRFPIPEKYFKAINEEKR